jgi:hypothetical protein
MQSESTKILKELIEENSQIVDKLNEEFIQFSHNFDKNILSLNQKCIKLLVLIGKLQSKETTTGAFKRNEVQTKTNDDLKFKYNEKEDNNNVLTHGHTNNGNQQVDNSDEIQQTDINSGIEQSENSNGNFEESEERISNHCRNSQSVNSYEKKRESEDETFSTFSEETISDDAKIITKKKTKKRKNDDIYDQEFNATDYSEFSFRRLKRSRNTSQYNEDHGIEDYSHDLFQGNNYIYKVIKEFMR